MKNKFTDYTCLFGGGAIRGTAYIGTLKALEEIGITPETIGGSSVGAIVATLFTLDYSANEIKDEFLRVNYDLFKDFNLKLGSKFALSKGEVFSNWMRELIEKKYYGDNYIKGENKPVTFKDLEKNLIIITTDLTNFKPQEFSKFETPDYEIAAAVRISCTMPGLMEPTEYNGKILVDGDLQKSIPMWKLSNNILPQSNHIIEFRLEGEAYNEDKNVVKFVNRIYSCVTSVCTDYISELYGKKDKFDYITINTGDIVVVDFNCPIEKREELIKKGYEQTIDYFRNILPKKKNGLLDDYNCLQKHINRIEKYIKHKQILKAKNEIGELFIDLCEQLYTIDTDIVKEIKEFNKLFKNNIKYPALFGSVKLSNQEEIIEKSDLLSKHISDKIYDLESYLCKH